jgi:hypothetical protein
VKVRKFLFAAALTLVASVSFASEAKDDAPKAGEVEKTGFMAIEWCIKEGYFKDCRLDSMPNSPVVLFVHSEGLTYKVDPVGVPMYELDEGIGKNNVTLVGKLEGNVIKARTYKAPPPEGKSFFKGCL